MKFKFVEFLNCKFIYNPNIHQEDEHILILWYGAYKELTKFIDKMTNRGYFVFTIDTTGKSFHIWASPLDDKICNMYTRCYLLNQ